MPMYGVSDINQLPELVVIGRLFKGASKKDSPNKPTDLDYFRFESPYPHLLQRFEQVYGKQPKSVNCLLPYDDYISPEGEKTPALYRNFDSWWLDMTGGKMVLRCDGNHVNKKRSESGQIVDCYEPCRCKAEGKKICKANGKLYVFIPELLPTHGFEQGLIGVVQLTTTSIFDNGKLAKQIAYIISTARAYSKPVQSIPLVLTRRLESVPIPGGKSRRDMWLCHLMVASEAAKKMPLLETGLNGMAALPQEDTEDEQPLEETEELMSPMDIYQTNAPAKKAPVVSEPPSISLPGGPVPEFNMPPVTGDENALPEQAFPVGVDDGPMPLIPQVPTANAYNIADDALKAWLIAEAEKAYGAEMTLANIVKMLTAMKADPITDDNKERILALLRWTKIGTYAFIQRETGNYYQHEQHLWNALKKTGAWGENNWPRPGDEESWQLITDFGLKHAQEKTPHQDPLIPELPQKEPEIKYF